MEKRAVATANATTPVPIAEPRRCPSVLMAASPTSSPLRTCEQNSSTAPINFGEYSAPVPSTLANFDGASRNATSAPLINDNVSQSSIYKIGCILLPPIYKTCSSYYRNFIAKLTFH